MKRDKTGVCDSYGSTWKEDGRCRGGGMNERITEVLM